MATIRELERAIQEGATLPRRVEDKLYMRIMECGVVPYPYLSTIKGEDPVLWEVDIAFDVPTTTEQSVVEAQITALEQTRQALLAKAEQEVQQINQRIQNLRALEHKPEASE